MDSTLGVHLPGATRGGVFQFSLPQEHVHFCQLLWPWCPHVWRGFSVLATPGTRAFLQLMTSTFVHSRHSVAVMPSRWLGFFSSLPPKELVHFSSGCPHPPQCAVISCGTRTAVDLQTRALTLQFSSSLHESTMLHIVRRFHLVLRSFKINTDCTNR